MKKASGESYSETETVKRREAALKRMLATPHKPHAHLKKKTLSRASAATKKPRKGA